MDQIGFQKKMFQDLSQSLKEEMKLLLIGRSINKITELKLNFSD